MQALRYINGAIASAPEDPEPYAVLADLWREQRAEVAELLQGANSPGAVLAQSYINFLENEMDDAAMAIGGVTGARPTVAWARAPWFSDACFLDMVSAGALAEALMRTMDFGHDLDAEDMRERLHPWFRAIDVVCARDPLPEAMAKMAIFLRACGRTDASFALCDRADSLEPIMLTEVVRAGTGRVPPSGVADHVKNSQVTAVDHGACDLVAYQPATLARKGYAPLIGWPQRVDPKHDRLHHDKGRDPGTCRKLGDSGQAAAAFQRALILEPTNWSLYLDLADLHAEHGEFASAVKLIEQGLEHGLTEITLRAAAAAYRTRLTGSPDYLRELIALVPQLPEDLYRSLLIDLACDGPDLPAELVSEAHRLR